MEKDNSTVKNTIPVNTNYLGSVENLISRIKSIKEQIYNISIRISKIEEQKKEEFNANWQKKCSHPEFYMRFKPFRFSASSKKEHKPFFNSYEESLFSKPNTAENLKRYWDEVEEEEKKKKARAKAEQESKSYYECSVCGMKTKDQQDYIALVDIDSTTQLQPISDSAKNLFTEKTKEFELLQEELKEYQEIKDLITEKDQLKQELNQLEEEANKIAKILDSELGIHQVQYRQRTYKTPDDDLFYPD